MKNIKLWKDNKLSKEYTIEFNEFRTGFMKFAKAKENENLCATKPYTFVLSYYINSTLQSGIEEEDKNILELMLRDEYLKILEDMNI